MDNQTYLFHPHREEVCQLPRRSAPFVEKSATSKAAAERTREGVSGEIRKRIFRYLVEQKEDGATDEEITKALGIAGDTVRPRRIELVRMGLVSDSGRCRQTRTGREATVWTRTQIQA